MSAAPARFTFALDMGHTGPATTARAEVAGLEAIEAARREAHAAGFAEGERSAANKAARQLATACETLGTRAAGLLAAEDARTATLTADAVKLALAIARKLSGGLIEKYPLAPLEALLAECVASLGSATHLIIRCHPDLAETLEATARERLDAAGFSGRVVIEKDTTVPLGDGRIAWADGAVTRNQEHLMAGIDEAIASFLAGPPQNMEPHR